MEIQISGPDELRQVAIDLLKYAGGRKKFGLIGEIGAGKTSLVQAICRQLGIRGEVSSPTFALVNSYAFDDHGEQAMLHHIDLYRLRDEEEAIQIGLEEYLYDDNYCLVEWPEIAENYFPEDTVWVKIDLLPDSGRKILFL